MGEGLYHGSHKQNLTSITPENGRFGEKVFATPYLQKAIRYMGNPEHGGTSWVTFDNDPRMFVFEANPVELLKASGSIYIVSPEAFAFDDHKGNRPWILSHRGPVDAGREIEFDSVLDAWKVVGVYAVPPDLKDELLGNKVQRKGAIDEVVRQQKQLLSGQVRNASQMKKENFPSLDVSQSES